MSNNRMPKKKVEDSKSNALPPQKRAIQVSQGNAAVLTVQLLNAINENLIEMKELLKEGING